MHHEVARVLRVVEILQKETARSATQIGKVGIRPRDGKAQVFIKLFGEREISCRHEGFDLDGIQIAFHELSCRAALELPLCSLRSLPTKPRSRCSLPKDREWPANLTKPSST